MLNGFLVYSPRFSSQKASRKHIAEQNRHIQEPQFGIGRQIQQIRKEASMDRRECHSYMWQAASLTHASNIKVRIVCQDSLQPTSNSTKTWWRPLFRKERARMALPVSCRIYFLCISMGQGSAKATQDKIKIKKIIKTNAFTTMQDKSKATAHARGCTWLNTLPAPRCASS